MSSHRLNIVVVQSTYNFLVFLQTVLQYMLTSVCGIIMLPQREIIMEQIKFEDIILPLGWLYPAH